MTDEAQNVIVLKDAYDRWAESKGDSADHWTAIFADKIKFGSLADGKRLFAVRGGDDIEIFRRQSRFQKLDVGGHVVDDENAGGHCGLPRKWRIVSMNLPTEIGFDR